ncbi:MAG: lipocalin family protein [Crocinitomicaceae bacterium]
MKKMTLLLALFTLILVGCGSEPSIEGKWKIESVSSEELTDAEKTLTVDFQADGKLVSERDGETREEEWELSEDGKTLTIKSGDREIENKVIELTEDKLVLKERDDKVTFSRLK